MLFKSVTNLPRAVAGAVACVQAGPQQQPSSKSGASTAPANPANPSVSTSSNPLLPNALFVQWDQVKPSHVIPAVKHILQEETAALDLLEEDLEAAGANVTYERIFKPYAQIRYRLDVTYGIIDHLQVMRKR